MVVLMFKNLDIPEGFTHKASDWQIAEDKYFKDIVVESRNDEKHLTSILFDVDLDPDKKYYARARVILDTGPSDWSEIHIVRTDDLNQIDLDIDIPSVVATPDVSLNFPEDKVPPTLFTIQTSPMSTNSDAKHIASDWLITDIFGRVMYSSFDNEADLTKHTISTIMLKPGEFYIAKAIHHSSSGDSSEFGSRMFFVPDAPEIKVKSLLEGVKSVKKNGMTVELEPVDDIDEIYVDFYMVGAGEAVKTFSDVLDKFIFKIPPEAFQNDMGTYLLAIKYKYINGDETNIKYFKVIASY